MHIAPARQGPFQHYDDVSDKRVVAPRLAALRAEMRARGLDGFILPRSDRHMNEYVPPRDERLAWLTAFTGSAGAAIVFAERATLFVDGRYTLQAAQQTDTDLFAQEDLVSPGPHGWLAREAPRGAAIGYDPWLHTQNGVELLRHAVEQRGARLQACADNPVDSAWPDQPGPPRVAAMAHPFNLAGETAASKRARMGAILRDRTADTAVLTLPDSICWLLNMRGGDLPHTPFALCFAILSADGGVDLFIAPEKVTPELRAHLGDVRLHGEDAFAGALAALAGRRVLADPATAAAAVFDALHAAGAVAIRAPDPCLLAKACKNPVEVEGARRAHVRDGAALVTFLAWFDANAPRGGLTEIDAAKKLESFRAATGALADLSFDSIAGAGEHGAIVHYRVTDATNRAIGRDEIFLIDSGAQYPDGTTDVTRTLMVGTPTDEMKRCFTLVLKGHIALATARFPHGTAGAQLDALARIALWRAGLDYDHGTGHGVGSYLSVHEGPQNISRRWVAQALMPGMICSNEPGYYKTGAFGIRIENLVVVTPASVPPGGERPMMAFETITLAPICRALIEPAMLTADERAWLNGYHARVRETLMPFIGEADVRDWLTAATAAV